MDRRRVVAGRLDTLNNLLRLDTGGTPIAHAGATPAVGPKRFPATPLGAAMRALLVVLACLQLNACTDLTVPTADGEASLTWIGLNGRRLVHGDTYHLPLDQADHIAAPGEIVREALRLDNTGPGPAVIHGATFLPSPEAQPREFSLLTTRPLDRTPPTFPLRLDPGESVDLDVAWTAPREPSPERTTRLARLRLWFNEAPPLDVVFQAKVRQTTSGSLHEPIGWPLQDPSTGALSLLTTHGATWWAASAADPDSDARSQLWLLTSSGHRAAWTSNAPGVACVDDGSVVWLGAETDGLTVSRFHASGEMAAATLHWPTAFKPTACRVDASRLLVAGSYHERPALATLSQSGVGASLSVLAGDELATEATDVVVAGDRVLMGWRAGARGAVAVFDRATLRARTRLQIDAPVEQLTELSDGSTAALLDIGGLYDVARIDLSSELVWRVAVDTDWAGRPLLSAGRDGEVVVRDSRRLWTLAPDGTGKSHYTLLPASATFVAGASRDTAWIAADRDDVAWRWEVTDAQTSVLDDAYDPADLRLEPVETVGLDELLESPWQAVAPPRAEGRWYHVPHPSLD